VIYYLEKRFRLSLRPPVIEGRRQVHEQHRRGKDDRTNEKRDVTVVEGCQKENWGADDRTHEPDPMADTIRYLLAGRLCPVPQGQRLVNSIHRTRSCNAYWAYLPNKKFWRAVPCWMLTLSGCRLCTVA